MESLTVPLRTVGAAEESPPLLLAGVCIWAAVTTVENATNAAAFSSTCFLFMSKPLVCLLKLLNALLTLFTPHLWPQRPAPQSSFLHQHEENRNQNQYVNG
jgi:hypothetical protein